MIIPSAHRQKLAALIDKSIKLHQEIARKVATGEDYDYLEGWTELEKVDHEVVAILRKYMTEI